jgi:16S rRNA G966 N2-methylase RsmD
VKAIRENLAALKLGDGFAIEARGAVLLLDELVKRGEKVDLVFLDPPYEAAAEYARTLEFLGGRGGAMLAEDARVIAEHLGKEELAVSYGRLERVRVLKQGDAALSFFALRTQ